MEAAKPVEKIICELDGIDAEITVIRADLFPEHGPLIDILALSKLAQKINPYT